MKTYHFVFFQPFIVHVLQHTHFLEHLTPISTICSANCGIRTLFSVVMTFSMLLEAISIASLHNLFRSRIRNDICQEAEINTALGAVARRCRQAPQETPHAARGVSDGPRVAAMAELAPARVRVLLVRARVRVEGGGAPGRGLDFEVRPRRSWASVVSGWRGSTLTFP